MRGNHFHTGVDLKTEGREGFVVIAATDGQVSRVKMSPWGYGNALYLDGPDGVTTVYAHLQRFAPKVQSWAVERTYAVRSLGLDASPPASAGLHFQAGDTLGWSGNSGGSGGPHLHFEIRSTANQHPLNPLDGWLDKVDTRPPLLPVLWVESPAERLRVALPVSDTLVLPGKTRFAIEGYDLLDGASNICGLRTLAAQVTSESGETLLTYRASWDELDFAVNKDMNAHAFYPVWSKERDQVHRLHRL
ncbi:MAG: M23 family metallopeptidase, partial [Flavobacteriales bacterium]|nr:M23 family metallopeptidase [Flavobacteriales bacterium]